jgi:hypothetical protein
MLHLRTDGEGSRHGARLSDFRPHNIRTMIQSPHYHTATHTQAQAQAQAHTHPNLLSTLVFDGKLGDGAHPFEGRREVESRERLLRLPQPRRLLGWSAQSVCRHRVEIIPIS